MKENNNEFAEYIDNEQICIKEGVPCKYGIPCCTTCFISGKRIITRSPIFEDVWFPTKGNTRKDITSDAILASLNITPIVIKGGSDIIKN